MSRIAGYVLRWNLTPDGNLFTTSTSNLLPVRFQNQPAMLKLTRDEEEKRGAGLMPWWNGDGAARVYAHDGDALLMERAMGPRSLAEMARSGHDDDACRVLCEVAAKLHAPHSAPSPATVSLTDWFRELWTTAERGGIWAVCAETARELLATPSDDVILHGDLHHGNVLDFGEGWRAIDPKGLRGERGFEFAALFLNPDFETASAVGRVARRAEVIAEAAGLSRTRLLRWVLAFAGLSAAWSLGTGQWAENALEIAAQAAAELGK